jgi:microcystin-dependent protein
MSSFKENNWENNPILMWTGLISDIPSGWVLCDGNNGTPNLLHDFVKGTSSPSKSSGETGGSHSITLGVGNIPSHTHSGSTNTAGSHTHDYPTTYDTYAYYSTIHQGIVNDNDEGFGNTHNGSHNHSATMSNTGGNSSIDNRPKYYEVAFIMKI